MKTLEDDAAGFIQIDRIVFGLRCSPRFGSVSVWFGLVCSASDDGRDQLLQDVYHCHLNLKFFSRSRCSSVHCSRGSNNTHAHIHTCALIHTHSHTHTHARSIVLSARAFYLWHLEPQRQEPSAHWDLISDVPRKWLRYVWASNAGDPNASNVDGDCNGDCDVNCDCDANCEGCDLLVVLFCFVSHSAARLNVPLSFPATTSSAASFVFLWLLRCPFHGMYSYVSRN